jgi:hypothetical protein
VKVSKGFKGMQRRGYAPNPSRKNTFKTRTTARRELYPIGETKNDPKRVSYLNMLFSIVIDRPDNGSCTKLRSINGCSRRDFHAIHTPIFKRQIFQHIRFPSVTFRYV